MSVLSNHDANISSAKLVLFEDVRFVEWMMFIYLMVVCVDRSLGEIDDSLYCLTAACYFLFP